MNRLGKTGWAFLIFLTLLGGILLIDAAGDIGRLLLDRAEHAAGLPVEAHGAVVIADSLDRLADDGGDGDVAAGGDLAADQHKAGLGEGFTSNAAVRVLGDDCVEDGIRDLIADLVRMPLGDGF